MPIHYYRVNNEKKGQLAISANVFQQAAEAAMTEAVSQNLKDRLSLKNGSKKAAVKCEIDPKNHVSVDVSVFGYASADVNAALADLQKAVYDRIYSLTEISKVKVHVSLSGIIATEKK